jgi:hypothetical protein
VTPRDVECEGFNVTYTRIASGSSLSNSNSNKAAVGVVPHHSLLETDVDRKVDESIESFLRSLSQIGPELLSVCICYYFILDVFMLLLLFHAPHCTFNGAFHSTLSF